MSGEDIQRLLDLIARFVDGRERTRSLAAEIEGLVVECFQHESWFDELSEALALFVPGGTTPYIDASELANELGSVSEVVRRAPTPRKRRDAS